MNVKLQAMKNSFTLSIPKPCSEKWDNFTPTAKGGFCASCQKEVVDFTTWSDDKIKLYFAQHANKPCGRFRPDQLKQYIPDTQRTATETWLPVSIVSVMLLGMHAAEAQVTTKASPDVEQHFMLGDVAIEPQSVAITEIHGVVKDESDGLPMPGVSVVLKGTTHGIATDAEGKFSVSCESLPADAVIVFSFIGYKTQEIAIGSYKGADVVINMDVDATVLGGLEVYRPYSPRNIWWKIKNIFR